MEKKANPSITALLRAGAQLIGPLPFEVPAPTATYRLKTGRSERGGDLYQPRSTGPLNGWGALIVHGGGFLVGSRTMKPVKGLMSELTLAGAWVAAMDYTLIPKGGTLSQMTAEVRETLLWCETKLAEQAGETLKLAGIGFSAGVAPLFHAACTLPKSTLDALVSVYGAMEFTEDPAPLIRVVYKRLLRDNQASRWPKQNPGDALLKSEFKGPSLFLHGTADSVCPPQTSKRIHQSRVDAGETSKLVLFPNQTHGFLNNPTTSNSQAAIAEIIKFLSASTPDP